MDQIHSSKKGIALNFLRAILFFVSLLYRLVMAVRNAFYDSCYQQKDKNQMKFFGFKVHSFKPQVISIGNIVAGGTGKTPLTILLAKKILAKKKTVAILSRGYKAKMEHSPSGSEQISKGQGPERSAIECGDEPYLMSRSVPEALFYVGKSRIESARKATDKKAQVILLDDGMQYRKLFRNYDVVILDAQDPFGRNYFLPRGLLREHPKSLKRANLLVINHVQDRAHFDKVLTQVRSFSSALAVATRPRYLKTILMSSRLEISLKGKKVIAFCGIAKPNYFFELLKQQGAIISSKYIFADHEPTPLGFLEKLSGEIRNEKVDFVVCTEKDAVKLENLKLEQPLAYIVMELEILYGQNELDQAIESMIFSAN